MTRATQNVDTRALRCRQGKRGHEDGLQSERRATTVSSEFHSMRQSSDPAQYQEQAEL